MNDNLKRYVAFIKVFSSLYKNRLITSSQKIDYYRQVDNVKICSTEYEIKHEPEPNIDLQKVRPKILLTQPPQEFNVSTDDGLTTYLDYLELMSKIANDQYIDPRYPLNILSSIDGTVLEHLLPYLDSSISEKDITCDAYYLDKSDILNVTTSVLLKMQDTTVHLWFSKHGTDEDSYLSMRVPFTHYPELLRSLASLNNLIGSVNLFIKYAIDR